MNIFFVAPTSRSKAAFLMGFLACFSSGSSVITASFSARELHQHGFPKNGCFSEVNAVDSSRDGGGMALCQGKLPINVGICSVSKEGGR